MKLSDIQRIKSLRAIHLLRFNSSKFGWSFDLLNIEFGLHPYILELNTVTSGSLLGVSQTNGKYRF